MDIIRPATDNLYKFLATSGAALVIVAITVWIQLGEATRNRFYEVKQDEAVAIVDYERWEGQLAAINQHQESLRSRRMQFLARFAEVLRTASQMPQEERDQRADEVEVLLRNGGIWGMNELRVIVEETYQVLGKEMPARDLQFFADSVQEQDKLIAQHERHLELAGIVDKQLGLVRVSQEHLHVLVGVFWGTSVICLLLSFMGFCISAWGFYSWWNRFQGVQDQLLAIELREAEAKLASNDGKAR